MGELSELGQEARLIQEIPQKLCECAANCKDVYVDALSKTQVVIVCQFLHLPAAIR